MEAAGPEIESVSQVSLELGHGVKQLPNSYGIPPAWRYTTSTNFSLYPMNGLGTTGLY